MSSSGCLGVPILLAFCAVSEEVPWRKRVGSVLEVSMKGQGRVVPLGRLELGVRGL